MDLGIEGLLFNKPVKSNFVFKNVNIFKDELLNNPN